MDADREPAAAGVDIIARQRALMGLVECPACVERQRVCGQHGAFRKQPPYLWFDLAMMHWSLPEFGTDDGKGRLVRSPCSAAEAHALKRPLDRPAAVNQSLDEFVLGRNGIDQEFAGF